MLRSLGLSHGQWRITAGDEEERMRFSLKKISLMRASDTETHQEMAASAETRTISFLGWEGKGGGRRVGPRRG